MVDNIFKVAVLLVIVAGVAAVVRPGSQGPQVIANSLGGFAKDLTAASH